MNGTGSYEFDWEVKAVRKGYENYEVIRDKMSLPEAMELAAVAADAREIDGGRDSEERGPPRHAPRADVPGPGALCALSADHFSTTTVCLWMVTKPVKKLMRTSSGVYCVRTW